MTNDTSTESDSIEDDTEATEPADSGIDATESTDSGIEAAESTDSGIDATESTDSGADATGAGDGARSSGRRGRRGGTWANADLRERLQWLALVVLAVVAVATLFAFYTNVSRLISIWASRRYEPAIQALFSLSVLATSLAGIAWLARNLD